MKKSENEFVKIYNDGKNYEKKYFLNCTTLPQKYIKPENACIIGKKDENIKHAIIGDSHATALADGFDSIFRKKNKCIFIYN